MRHQTLISTQTLRGGGTWVEDTRGQYLIARHPNDGFHIEDNTIGTNYLKLTVAMLPAHTHTFTGTAHHHSVGAHAHGLNNHTHSIPALSGTAASAGSHAHYVTHGNNTEGRNRLFLNTKTGGPSQLRISYAGAQADGTYVMAASNGAHTHSVTTTASTSGKSSGNTANSTAFNSGNATQGGTIGNTGSGSNVPIMPWSKICIRWHRTA